MEGTTSPEPETPYNIKFVDEEFTDAFTRRLDDCDSHALKPHTNVVLKDEINVGDPITHVIVRGEYPWEYRHYTTVQKAELEREKERIRRKYGDDEQAAKNRIKSWATIEAIAEEIAATVTNDPKATPYETTINDYDIWIEIVEHPQKYNIMIAWEPERNP